jgi:hypothetical protein
MVMTLGLTNLPFSTGSNSSAMIGDLDLFPTFSIPIQASGLNLPLAMLMVMGKPT